MRLILTALTAVSLLAGIAASQPAEARCYFNGFKTVCVRHSGPMYRDWGYRHHVYRDFDRPIYRDWY